MGTNPQVSDGESLLNASGGDVGAGWSLGRTSSSALSRVDADTRRESASPKVKATVNRSMPRSPLRRRPSTRDKRIDKEVCATCSGRGTCQRPTASPFLGLGRLNHDRSRLERMNQSQRIDKIAEFIVRTRLTRIPMAQRTLSTMDVSSVLDSLPELGNL